MHGISVAAQTIQRVFRDLGLHWLPSRRKRRPKQLRLFSKDQPGDSIQVDVKFVRVNHQRCFQYTALDNCTRFRVACSGCIGTSIIRPAWRSSVSSGRRPFPIRKLQFDNGTEWPLAFALRWKTPAFDIATSHRHGLEQNGKVERSHRIDDEEFWQRPIGCLLRACQRSTRGVEHRYNHERFSMACGRHAPGEMLAMKLNARPIDHDASTGARS